MTSQTKQRMMLIAIVLFAVSAALSFGTALLSGKYLPGLPLGVVWLSLAVMFSVVRRKRRDRDGTAPPS